ncbi:MAG: hypothetical protein ABIR62_12935 [Dokdonella sp.]
MSQRNSHRHIAASTRLAALGGRLHVSGNGLLRLVLVLLITSGGAG